MIPLTVSSKNGILSEAEFKEQKHRYQYYDSKYKVTNNDPLKHSGYYMYHLVE